MNTQSKVLVQSNLKIMLDVVMIGLGFLFGGIVAIISVWLWLDYQANLGDSFLMILYANLSLLISTSFKARLHYQAELMGLPLTGHTTAYWYMARAGGIVGYWLLWVSTIWGLVLSTKITARLIPAPLAYGLHEFLSVLAIVFSVLHAVVLLGDQYIQFNIFHLAIPFISPYQPLWTGLGIIGFYLMIAMTGSFYIRKQIGQKIWRILHYFTFVAYLLILGHGIMAGTDTSLLVMKFMYMGTGLSVLFLTYYRLFTLKVKR